MEEKLTRLFDFQRFGGNARLNAIIAGAEERYAGALSDDDLGMVSAAGETCVPTEQPDVLLGRHVRPGGREEEGS